MAGVTTPRVVCGVCVQTLVGRCRAGAVLVDQDTLKGGGVHGAGEHALGVIPSHEAASAAASKGDEPAGAAGLEGVLTRASGRSSRYQTALGKTAVVA